MPLFPFRGEREKKMKNLKVGDTFVEGDCTYKVLEVVPEGYIAKMIKGMDDDDIPVKEETPAIQEEETPAYSKTQVNRMPNAELEKLCKELGLEVGTGTEMKRSIISKLGL